MKLPTKLIIDVIESDHYLLGGGFIGTKEINPLGDWEKFLPKQELQNINGVETYDCTAFGTNNAIETLLKFSFYIDPNLSDRFVGIMAGTKATGNSPHTVAESIRKNGEIDEEELPFGPDILTFTDFYSFKGADQTRCKNLGLQWLKNWLLQHEWVFNGGTIASKNALISQALKRSPVAMSVAAWDVPDAQGINHQSWPDNHWVCCYGETPTAWKIFDSYDSTHKLYSKESDIAMAKLYWITKLNPANTKTFLDYITMIWNIIFPKPVIITEKVEDISPDAPKVTTPTKTDISLSLFCLAMQEFEDYVLPGEKDRSGKILPLGSLSYQNKNPGNLKQKPIPWKLSIGADKFNHAIFKTYGDGFKTLKDMVYYDCIGEGTKYGPETTIAEFFKGYAEKNQIQYAEYVSAKLKCGTDLKLKELIID